MIKTIIIDPETGQPARITQHGQLVTSPIAFSTPVTKDMDIIDTAFNFVVPEDGLSTVITGIFVSADNGVSNVVPAEVEIYTANSAVSTTVITSILQPRVIRSDNVPLSGLNLLVGEGVWINGKTNDIGILLTVMFYKVPVVGDV